VVVAFLLIGIRPHYPVIDTSVAIITVVKSEVWLSPCGSSTYSYKNGEKEHKSDGHIFVLK